MTTGTESQVCADIAEIFANKLKAWQPLNKQSRLTFSHLVRALDDLAMELRADTPPPSDSTWHTCPNPTLIDAGPMIPVRQAEEIVKHPAPSDVAPKPCATCPQCKQTTYYQVDQAPGWWTCDNCNLDFFQALPQPTPSPDVAREIANLDLSDHQTIVDLMFLVQIGHVSCRRAATEIQVVSKRGISLAPSDKLNALIHEQNNSTSRFSSREMQIMDVAIELSRELATQAAELERVKRDLDGAILLADEAKYPGSVPEMIRPPSTSSKELSEARAEVERIGRDRDRILSYLEPLILEPKDGDPDIAVSKRIEKLVDHIEKTCGAENEALRAQVAALEADKERLTEALKYPRFGNTATLLIKAADFIEQLQKDEQGQSYFTPHLRRAAEAIKSALAARKEQP